MASTTSTSTLTDQGTFAPVVVASQVAGRGAEGAGRAQAQTRGGCPAGPQATTSATRTRTRSLGPEARGSLKWKATCWLALISTRSSPKSGSRTTGSSRAAFSCSTPTFTTTITTAAPRCGKRCQSRTRCAASRSRASPTEGTACSGTSWWRCVLPSFLSPSTSLLTHPPFFSFFFSAGRARLRPRQCGQVRLPEQGVHRGPVHDPPLSR